MKKIRFPLPIPENLEKHFDAEFDKNIVLPPSIATHNYNIYGSMMDYGNNPLSRDICSTNGFIPVPVSASFITPVKNK